MRVWESEHHEFRALLGYALNVVQQRVVVSLVFGIFLGLTGN